VTAGGGVCCAAHHSLLYFRQITRTTYGLRYTVHRGLTKIFTKYYYRHVPTNQRFETKMVCYQLSKWRSGCHGFLGSCCTDHVHNQSCNDSVTQFKCAKSRSNWLFTFVKNTTQLTRTFHAVEIESFLAVTGVVAITIGASYGCRISTTESETTSALVNVLAHPHTCIHSQ